ncbi:MAG: hypothetical protein R3E62_04395 [Pseudomonadales bacterium]
MRKHKRRKGIAVERQPLELPSAPISLVNGFVMDALANGRRLKTDSGG